MGIELSTREPSRLLEVLVDKDSPGDNDATFDNPIFKQRGYRLRYHTTVSRLPRSVSSSPADPQPCLTWR